MIVLRKLRRCGAIVHLLFCIEESNKGKNEGGRLKMKIAAQSIENRLSFYFLGDI